MTYEDHPSGAREILEPDAYRAAVPGAVVATCGACGRIWDDAHASSVTPTPAARCPFEYDHEDADA